MNFGGKFERAIDAMVEAVNALPSVGLVVMDDWCEASGKSDGERLRHIKRFSEACPKDIAVLLISKEQLMQRWFEDPIKHVVKRE